MLSKNKNNRPSAKKLLDHRFFKKFKENPTPIDNFERNTIKPERSLSVMKMENNLETSH